jgi:hypothetical protein
LYVFAFLLIGLTRATAIHRGKSDGHAFTFFLSWLWVSWVAFLSYDFCGILAKISFMICSGELRTF